MQPTTFRQRFWSALLTNSLHYPVLNLLLEWLVISHAAFFFRVDPYLIVTAAAIQAAVLAMPAVEERALRVLGANLVGPAVYTAVEMLMEGMEFWDKPNHVLYWVYSLIIGLFAAWRARVPECRVAIFGAYLARAVVLLAVYAVGEYFTAPTMTLMHWVQDPTHAFLGAAVPLLGIVGALADVNAQRYMLLLQDANRRLQTYAEWFFGKRLFRELVENPRAGEPRRQQRAIFFSDVRGFTAWSEERTPEALMEALQAWYLAAEEVWERCRPVRYKFTADEVMAVFASVEEAARAALLFRRVSESIWQPHGLSVGIGIHWGPVVEGLIGGREVKYYDVIGDTVNTAQRIEKGARQGEILISEKAYRRLPPEFEAGPLMTIAVKDKPHLQVRALRGQVERGTTQEYVETQEALA